MKRHAGSIPIGIALLGPLLLSACATLGPDYVRPEAEAITGWKGGALNQASADRRVERNDAWWTAFKDPVLDALIHEAMTRNHSVRATGLRILEARAQLGIADSSRYPQLQQVNGSALQTGQLRDGSDTHAMTYGIGANLGWEIDFWGKFQRSIEAADASYFATLAQYDDIQVLMAAQVASLYVSIRTLEARLQIAHENARLQARSLEITQKLFRSGNSDELDVQQARTQYLSTLASIPAIEASLRQGQNALGILLARAPGPLPEMSGDTGKIPHATLALAMEMPADLIRRRPDVRAAERQMAAQSALIGVREAELYPSLTLLGSVGLSTTSLAGSSSTLEWGMGPSVKWNVFDHGLLSNAVLVQDARFQQLRENYQETLLRAAREIDDAAIGFARSEEQISLLEQSELAARRSLDIANIRYREGMADFQRVLDSQRALFNQQERLISSRGDVMLNLISLYKAMGGGWQQGRNRPLLDEESRRQMQSRNQWGSLLTDPLPAPDAP
ncbi:efflux transporter outer membrane subunit [Aeromonas enterica]